MCVVDVARRAGLIAASASNRRQCVPADLQGISQLQELATLVTSSTSTDS